MEHYYMETIHKCPICSYEKSKLYLYLKDWCLSQENFQIEQCENCGFLFTNPMPSLKDLGEYYRNKEYLLHSKNRNGIVNGLYKFVKAYMIKQKHQIIKIYKSGKTILDIGAGTGEFLNFFKHCKWDVKGIEQGEDARNFSVNQYGIKVKNEDFLQELPEEYFDVITMWHSLERVRNLNEGMQEIYRLLKSNGIVIIGASNPEAFDAEIYNEYWAAYDVPRHLYHFRQKDIRNLIQKHNFRVKDVYPMKFDAFYVSMLSEKYKYGKVNYWNAFRNGIKSNIKAGDNTNYSSIIYVIEKDEIR